MVHDNETLYTPVPNRMIAKVIVLQDTYQTYALWARYRRCGPGICTAGLSVMITPGPQAINQLKHPIVSGGIHALRPWASCVYTSRIPHWDVLTNTYVHCLKKL